MEFFIKRILPVFIALFITGCEEKLTYRYLMTHPFVVQEKVEECQSIPEANRSQMATCNLVMKAAHDLTPVINEQRFDPERFGLKIMDVELAYTQAKEKWQLAQQSLRELKGNHAPPAKIQEAQNQLTSAESTYLKQQQELDVLLAVAGMNSPE